MRRYLLLSLALHLLLLLPLAPSGNPGGGTPSPSPLRLQLNLRPAGGQPGLAALAKETFNRGRPTRAAGRQPTAGSAVILRSTAIKRQKPVAEVAVMTAEEPRAGKFAPALQEVAAYRLALAEHLRVLGLPGIDVAQTLVQIDLIGAPGGERPKVRLRTSTSPLTSGLLPAVQHAVTQTPVPVAWRGREYMIPLIFL